MKGFFDKNKLKNYFEKIKKRRLKKRRKRFIELEKEKLKILTDNYNLIVGNIEQCQQSILAALL